MEVLRKEVLEEMVRNGRSYKHEVKLLAEEALHWRAGRDPTAFDGMIIQVPQIVLKAGYQSAFKVREMLPGEVKCIRFEPLSGRYIHTIVFRTLEP